MTSVVVGGGGARSCNAASYPLTHVQQHAGGDGGREGVRGLITPLAPPTHTTPPLSQRRRPSGKEARAVQIGGESITTRFEGPQAKLLPRCIRCIAHTKFRITLT
jgi:hypothetical protein